MNSHQTDWEKNIIDNADSYSIVEWRPLDKSTKTIVKTYDEANKENEQFLRDILYIHRDGRGSILSDDK